MASVVYCIVLLCLTSGLWMEAEAKRDCSGSCRHGWTRYDCRCFIFRHYEMNWATAERHCIGLGGNLASIRSTSEYYHIRQLVRSATGTNRNVWVGGNDGIWEGWWMWSDGSRFSFNHWRSGEPNNYHGKEDCMEMNFRGGDSVNDADCRDKINFVCSSSY
ncbi:galactose-specific lectin nattectin-like [Trematomus bernacchii]|uniref:galactose-specific lectin nattectin-like n=1 Tax=Trematomus bernacchii TaxID=40690 RepID=UPI00146E5244|nr:galactose-specific lectin nattectin-like [Trematomus bernacchii]